MADIPIKGRTAPAKAQNRTPAERRAVLVLGMHRSGTSALAGLLQKLGAGIPATLVPPSPENPKGYFESRKIMAINDEVLATLKSAWFGLQHIGPEWFDSRQADTYIQRAMQIILEEFPSKGLIAIKDPRICRLAPLWLEALDRLEYDTNIIVPVREPLEVALSLSKRDNFDIQFSLILWLRYNLDAELYSRSYSRLVLSFDELLENANAVIDRAVSFMGIDSDLSMSVDASSFVAPELKHNTADSAKEHRLEPIAQLAHDVFQRLLLLRQMNHHPSVFEALDNSRNDLERLLQLTAGSLFSGAEARRSINKNATELRRLQQKQRTTSERIVSLERELRRSQTERYEQSEYLQTLQRAIRDHEKQGAKLRREIKQHKRTVEGFQNSTIWRMSKPLRVLGDALRVATSRSFSAREPTAPRPTPRHPLSPTATLVRDDHVSAAFRYGRSGEWHLALQEWQAAIDDAPSDALENEIESILHAILATANSQDTAVVGHRLLDALAARGIENRQTRAVRGILYLRARDHDNARRHWQRYWNDAVSTPGFAAENGLRYPYRRQRSLLFPHAASQSEIPAEDNKKVRVCVYTAVFGGYDDPPSPLFKPTGWDFVCFSDRPIEAPGWCVKIIDPGQPTPMMNNRRIKILPYEYLHDYEYTLYIDANIQLVGDLRLFFRYWLSGRDFVAWEHPERSDVYDECEAILSLLRHTPDAIVAQHEFLCNAEVPRDTGLIEASFLWRSHENASIRELMNEWWQCIEHGGRDQPAFGYLMWKKGPRPALMPEDVGTARKNDFFLKRRHRLTALDSATTRLPAISPQQNVRVHTVKKRLAWVYRASAVQTATLMRGEQLYRMAKGGLSETIDVDYVEAGTALSEKQSILFLTRSFLRDTTVEEMTRLKAQGNILCVDNVDHHAREELHPLVDVYLAASILQFVSYGKVFPDKVVHLITHHVDPCVTNITPPKSYCSIGYFGEMVNARYAAELQGVIDFVQTNNMKYTSRNWLNKLNQCNVHYAVRQGRPADGFKPFTKGFTAAHSGANIIVPYHEGDARFYLTAEYPYLLRSESLDAVMNMIEYVNDTFNSSTWRLGLEIMEAVKDRSSNQYIVAEIESLVERLCS